MARQGLSRLLVTVAVLTAGLAWMGFTFQRTVFEPSRSERMVRVLLDSPEVRHELVQQVIDGVDGSLPPDIRAAVSLPELTSAANATLDNPKVQTAIEQSLVGTQRYLIGDSDIQPSLDTALIDAELRRQLTAVNPVLAGVVPTLPPLQIDLPAAGVSPIRKLRALVDQITPLLALVALVAAVGALVVAPDRGKVLRRIGAWAFSAGAIWVVLRFALPALAKALLPSSAAIVAALTEAVSGSMAAPGVALAVTGVVLYTCGGLLGYLQRQGSSVESQRRVQERAAARAAKRQEAADRREAARAAKATAAAAKPAPAAAGSQGQPSDDAGVYRPPAGYSPPAQAQAHGYGEAAYAPGSSPSAAGAHGDPGLGGAAWPNGASSAAQALAQPASFHSAAGQVPTGPSPLPPTQVMPTSGSVGPAGPPMSGIPTNAANPAAPGPPGIGGVPAGPVARTTTEPLGPANATSGVFAGQGGAVAGEYAPTISIPLPKRERGTGHAEVTPNPGGPAVTPGSTDPAAVEPNGEDALIEPKAARTTPRPTPNEWLGGFSMDPADHDRIADPAPPPPRWIEGVGYVYEYAPTSTARWIDGLGYVLADE